MHKITMIITVLAVLSTSAATGTSADDGTTAPLKRYSAGFGFGASAALNEALQDQARQFLHLTMTQTVYLSSSWNMFCDVDLFIPKGNVGASAGVDRIFSRGDFAPLAGIGAGVLYLSHEGEFGDDFGPSVTAHAGFRLTLSNRVAMRMRVPYHFIVNRHRDHMVGCDVSFIFSHRYKNIRKLSND